MNGICYLCGSQGTVEIHHCLSGSYRKLADKYKITVQLCPYCHRYIHSGEGAKTKRKLAATAQESAMDRNQWDKDTWLKIFGKSWI